jgi:CRISPR/Cas system-associated exonuclease Cas4 (RecB family)
MDIKHISVSRKGIWDDCQQKYKYQYHLKTPSPEPTPFYFTYGRIIHKIAEEFVNHKGEMLLEEVAREILRGKVPVDTDKEGNPVMAPQLPLDYKQRVSGHLKSIQKLTDQLGVEGKTEHAFTYDLDPPNQRMITGVIDRLFEKNGVWYIIDYKTTKRGPWRKTSQTIVDDLQLRCYARVVQREFNVPANKIKTALYYLEGGNLIGAQFSEESLLAAEQELLKAHMEIQKADPEKVWGNVTSNCRRCEFKSMCPFYNLTSP